MAATATKRPAVINAYLSDDGRDVILREQTPTGGSRERRVRAEYVTWHRDADLGRVRMRQLKALDIVRSIQTVGSYTRIGWAGDSGRHAGRNGMKENHVETYEGDIDPVLLYLVESRAEIAKPRRCYLDLEADSRVSIAMKENMRILSWAVVDHETGEEFVGVLTEDDDDAEEVLLRELKARLEHYDQIAVWEGDWKGGAFDSVVMPARMQRCGVDFDMRRWLMLNQLAVWKRMNSAESGAEKESFKLEDIAFAQLGEGKEEIPQFVIDRFGADKCSRGLGPITWELWNEGGEFRELLARYNARDSQLLRKLELKKGFVALFQALCEVCGIPPVTQSLFPTRQMDSFMLRLGRERDHRFPTKKYRDEEEAEEEQAQFRGAYVFHPKSIPGDKDGPEKWTAEDARAWRAKQGMTNGVLREVHVCDFASLYPSVMRTWNLSADVVLGFANSADEARKTFGPNVCWSPGTGLVTRSDVVGFLPLALAELIRLRKEYSDLAASLPPGSPEWMIAKAKSDAYKVAANSFYGAGGSKFSRFYNRDVSEACTQNAVHLLKITAAEAEARAMVIAYGDTDSAFAFGPTQQGFARFVEWLNKKRFPAEVVSCGCTENYIKLAFEKTFERLVFVSAKAYIGRFSQYKGTPAKRECHGTEFKHDEVCATCGGHGRLAGEPEIKGLAWKRGDRGRLARDLQGRIIDLLVGGVKVRGPKGTKVPINADLEIETPSTSLELHRRIIGRAQKHILEDRLTLDEVRFSKSLSKSLREYAKDAKEPQVRVGRILKERGQSVGAKTRIEYVVVDASVTPQLVIPADDYVGECDRFYLWERAFSPTLSLLEAAFPDENWEDWTKVRPAKPKKGRAPNVDQLGLHLDGRPKLRLIEGGKIDEHAELAVPAYRTAPLVVRIPEAAGKAGIEAVAEVLKAHPGAREVKVVLVLNSGAEAVLHTSARVSPSPRFKEELEEALAQPRGPDQAPWEQEERP